MTQEAIEEFSRSYETQEILFRAGRQHTMHVLRLELLTRDLRGEAPVRILDFGCGYGAFLATCALYGFEAFGIDRSEARRQHAKFDRILPEIADLKKLGVPPFHALTLFEVLEHLDDPKSLLEVLKDFLLPGGILVLETPDCTGVKSISTLADYRKIHPLEHINGFTPESMQRLAERLGFIAIKKPVSHVTCDFLRVAKHEVTGAIRGALPPRTTQQYFRKL